MKSSYPYRFVPGQPGQPGQTTEILTNRAFRVFNLHICTGTQPGHAGTLRNQDVSGRAKRHIQGRANRPGVFVNQFTFGGSGAFTSPAIYPALAVDLGRSAWG